MRVLVRHVGSQIGAPLPDMDLTTASQDPSVYHAGETNLAGAISSFKVGYQNVVAKPGMGSNGDQSAVNDPPDPPPPARFQVLVTDGVQSTKKGSTVQDCTAGSDQFCVRQKIAELLNAGWAGVVLGIRSDFHGKVYSEVSGAAIPFETRSNSLATFRPFYLLHFSPDAKSLDALVRSLKDRLRPLVNNCADCIRELNLSFPYTDGFADFEITIPKESREALQKARNQGGPPPRFTIHVDVDTEGSALSRLLYRSGCPGLATPRRRRHPGVGSIVELGRQASLSLQRYQRTRSLFGSEDPPVPSGGRSNCAGCDDRVSTGKWAAGLARIQRRSESEFQSG